jgi:hypothetical protein
VTRPLACRHLSRLNELVTAASICRVAVSRAGDDAAGLEWDAIKRAAESDLSAAEEVQTIARERTWTLARAEDYQWKLMDPHVDLLPRVMRILDRDAFELAGMARETDDDEVSSLALQVLEERRALLATLRQGCPEYTLPGQVEPARPASQLFEPALGSAKQGGNQVRWRAPTSRKSASFSLHPSPALRHNPWHSSALRPLPHPLYVDAKLLEGSTRGTPSGQERNHGRTGSSHYRQRQAGLSALSGARGQLRDHQRVRGRSGPV